MLVAKHQDRGEYHGSRIPAPVFQRGIVVFTRARGFSLAEILVVTMLIVLIVGITLPVYFNISRRQKRDTCINQLYQLGVALAQYREDYGEYPAAPMPSFLEAPRAVWAGDWVDGAAYKLGEAVKAPSGWVFRCIANHTASTANEPGVGANWKDVWAFYPETPFVHSPPEGVAFFQGAGKEQQLIVEDLYTGITPVEFTIEIIAQGTPDKFQWKKDNGTFSTPIDITGNFQDLSDGVRIKFPVTTGYQVLDPDPVNGHPADAWTIAVGLIPQYWRQWELNTTTGLYELVDFEGVNMPDRVQAVGNNSMNRSGHGNLGLATLFYEYLTDRRDYLKSRRTFHCPTMLSTEKRDTTAVLDILSNIPHYDKMERSFDPLWNEYNTYDFTYNYDQFYNGIKKFDEAMGFGELNTPRQLRNKDCPGDTVVAWCYAHDGELRTFATPDPANPDPPDAWAPANNAERTVQEFERSRRRETSLVLWVDGTVGMMRPTLERRKDNYTDPLNPSETNYAYYWVPPCLYSPGDWRK
jgi:type II secretory pathway pseudopilin PulG